MPNSKTLFFMIAILASAPTASAQTAQKYAPDILDAPAIRQQVDGAISKVEMFGTNTRPVTVEEVTKMARGAKIEVTKKDQFGWTEIRFEFDSATLTLTRRSADTEQVVKRLKEFTNFIFNDLADKKMDPHVYQLIRKTMRTNQLYLLAGEPALPGASIEFVKKFAAKANALVQVGDNVSAPDLQELLGLGKKVSKSAVVPEFESATQRKERTMKALAKRKLVAAPSLPSIAADEETRLRDAKDVARRAVCLLAVAAHAEKAEGFDAMAFIKKHNATDALSPKEKNFLENTKLTDEQRSKMTWRYEALWALLWSLGKVDEIGFPDHPCDAKIAIGVVYEGADELIKNAKLRDTAEILNEADLLYRSYWLVRDGMRKQTPPTELSGSVVYERLFALNWLIQYMKTDWDETVVDS